MRTVPSALLVSNCSLQLFPCCLSLSHFLSRVLSLSVCVSIFVSFFFSPLDPFRSLAGSLFGLFSLASSLALSLHPPTHMHNYTHLHFCTEHTGMKIVRIHKRQLVLGIANAWAGVGDPIKALYLTPSQLSSVYTDLCRLKLRPR